MENMHTHSNREKLNEPSDTDFEAALNAALRDGGYFFPTTEEEVASLKASMDMEGVPTPDIERFRQAFREAAEKIVQLPSSGQLRSHDVDADLDNLAMVARNGSQISEEVRKRMNADRTCSKDQTRKKHGTD